MALECNIVAIKINKDCDNIYCKNLDHTTYFLNNRCIEDENGEIIINKDYHNIYPQNISISAIVGMNGSGKSALLEIIYRIINNFSCLLERDLPRSASERLCFVKKLYADLYYVINEELYCISCIDENVKLLKKKNNYELLNLYVSPNNSPNQKYASYKEKDIINYTQHLFYTIVTNYSIQSYICTDYRKEPTFQILSDGKSNISRRDIWLSSLFHKNDGYITPIVLNPYRDMNGNIDVQKEFRLTVNRLVSILYYFKNRKEDFIEGYELEKIEYEYDSEYVTDKYIRDNGNASNIIRKKLWNFNYTVLNRPNCYASIILEKLGYKNLIIPHSNKSKEIACAYLVYKILSIASKYPSYEEYKKLVIFINMTNMLITIIH